MPFTLTPVAPGPAIGYYAAQVDVEDVYGRANIASWSQLATGDTTTDTARIQRALDYADATIDNYFRNGPYPVPLACGSGSPTVRHWAGIFAGAWLYTHAAPLALTKPGVLPDQLVSSALAEMDRYKSGTAQFALTPVSDASPTAPTISE